MFRNTNQFNYIVKCIHVHFNHYLGNLYSSDSGLNKVYLLYIEQMKIMQIGLLNYKCFANEIVLTGFQLKCK